MSSLPARSDEQYCDGRSQYGVRLRNIRCHYPGPTGTGGSCDPQLRNLSEILLPQYEVIIVDNLISIAVRREAASGLFKRVSPNSVVRRIDAAVAIVVALQFQLLLNPWQ